MGKLFKTRPVVMEIQALKVAKNRDFSENFHPRGREIQWNPMFFVQNPSIKKTKNHLTSLVFGVVRPFAA